VNSAFTRVFLASLALALVVLVGNSGSAGAADEFDKYALESVDASLTTTQAGAHPDLTTFFAVTRNGSLPYAFTKDVEVHLPPGMIGNPQAIPRCTVAQLGNGTKDSECPRSTQVGLTAVRVIAPISATFREPVYNMSPPANSDIVARFGFFAGFYPAFINVRVDPTDYSLVAAIEGAPSAAGLLEATTTIWGVPAAHVHDADRLTPYEAGRQEAPKEPFPTAGVPEAPLLSNPTDCSRQRQVTISVRSYQRPDVTSTMSASLPPITGCAKLAFAPRFTATPTNPEAAAPSGLDASLQIPQDETPNGLATSTLKSAVVTLPEGMTINPAAGDGLAACSAEQVAYGKNEAARCPDAAKIGSAEIEVPALEHTLRGSVYQRTPEPGHLFRFWLVADEMGVHLKLPAEISLDPLTGRLTTVFSGIDSLGGLPQVPVSDLKLHVFGGPRAPLATPASCGAYQTSFSFTPWSGGLPVQGQTAMEITSGCEKGGFKPGLSAGTLNTNAGRFSPFTFTLTRRDGEANPQALAVHLPQGLLAKLAGVPLCGDAEAVTGACPARSKVGSVSAAAGVGGAPLWIPQPGKAPTAVYLAGPYRGAPYSMVAVVPAQAGPFDLGTVVTRAALRLDPKTAAATVTTDPLPQILEGVPIAYRTLNVTVDRSEFTLNPTDCEPKQIAAFLTASDGETAEPRAPFKATDCAKLGFKPKLSLKLKGQMKRSGNPQLTAVLKPRKGDANIGATSVLLPHAEFIDQFHINSPCTRVQYAEGDGRGSACPKGSVIGTVKAWSPLLDEPLAGKLYFRSNGGERELPDVVMSLSGQVDIEQVGFVDSRRGRIRTRFLSVPDAPLSKVVLKLFGGKRGLLENSTNLCAHPQIARVTMSGQNGRSRAGSERIATKCGGGKAKASR
jgi:hypothetical protein